MNTAPVRRLVVSILNVYINLKFPFCRSVHQMQALSGNTFFMRTSNVLSNIYKKIMGGGDELGFSAKRHSFIFVKSVNVRCKIGISSSIFVFSKTFIY